MNNKLLYLALVLGLSFVANASDQLAQQEEAVTQSCFDDTLDRYHHRYHQGDRLTFRDLMNSPELVSKLKSIKLGLGDKDDRLQLLSHARELEHLEWVTAVGGALIVLTRPK